MESTPDPGEVGAAGGRAGGGVGAGGMGRGVGAREATKYGTLDLSSTFPKFETARIVSMWDPFGSTTGAMFTLFEKTSHILCPLSHTSRWKGTVSLAEAEIGSAPYTVVFARGLVIVTLAKAGVKQGTRAKDISAAITLFIGEEIPFRVATFRELWCS